MEKIDNSTVIVADFNAPLSIMDRVTLDRRSRRIFICHKDFLYYDQSQRFHFHLD